MTLGELIPPQYRSDGLSRSELSRAQDAARTVFPPDLCELLTETLPIGPTCPDWRGSPRSTMDEWREHVIDEIVFDVLQNGFWLHSWGERPAEAAAIQAVVRDQIAAAPDLIPIYGHRGIPNEPSVAGNPVFSVVQTDVIIYGGDLDEYLRNEFHRGSPALRPLSRQVEPREIRFWSAMVGIDS